jgi:hypothetical protein
MSDFRIRANGKRLVARWQRIVADRSLPFRSAWVQRWIVPQIVHWKEPVDLPLESSVEVHLLTSARDWKCAAWALASFVHATERRWNIVIHDDGTLGDVACRTLLELFPTARIKDRKDADAEMEARLAGRPRCLEYRRTHALALKLFDCTMLAGTERLILLDSDLAFFQRPDEVLDWVKSGKPDCMFNPDFQDAYCLSRDSARKRLQVDLHPRINTGLSLLPRAVVDVDFCEQSMADHALSEQESIAWREQTLLALCASRYGTTGLLSDRYEVHFEPWMSDDAITRHYVGDIRPLYYAEGIWRLRGLVRS